MLDNLHTGAHVCSNVVDRNALADTNDGVEVSQTVECETLAVSVFKQVDFFKHSLKLVDECDDLAAVIHCKEPFAVSAVNFALRTSCCALFCCFLFSKLLVSLKYTLNVAYCTNTLYDNACSSFSLYTEHKVPAT